MGNGGAQEAEGVRRLYRRHTIILGNQHQARTRTMFQTIYLMIKRCILRYHHRIHGRVEKGEDYVEA